MKPHITRVYSFSAGGWVWECSGDGLATWGRTPSEALRPWRGWWNSAGREASALVLRLYEGQG